MTTETVAQWIAEARNLQERGEQLLPKLDPERQAQMRAQLAELEAALAEPMSKQSHAHWPTKWASRPTTWDVWSAGEREGYFRERAAYKDLDEGLSKVRKGVSWDVAEAVLSAAHEVRYAVLDQRLARLKRYRPDLADLFDWAFDEGRDAMLVDIPGEQPNGEPIHSITD